MPVGFGSVVLGGRGANPSPQAGRAVQVAVASATTGVPTARQPSNVNSRPDELRPMSVPGSDPLGSGAQFDPLPDGRGRSGNPVRSAARTGATRTPQ